MLGHRLLDDQSEHLDEYMESGICTQYLSRHPIGQVYSMDEP